MALNYSRPTGSREIIHGLASLQVEEQHWRRAPYAFVIHRQDKQIGEIHVEPIAATQNHVMAKHGVDFGGVTHLGAPSSPIVVNTEPLLLGVGVEELIVLVQLAMAAVLLGMVSFVEAQQGLHIVPSGRVL